MKAATPNHHFSRFSNLGFAAILHFRVFYHHKRVIRP